MTSRLLLEGLMDSMTMDLDVYGIVLDGMKTELGDRIDHLGFDAVREELARALHDVLCNDTHDEPDTDPYEPETGGMTRYQRQADVLLELLGQARSSSETENE